MKVSTKKLLPIVALFAALLMSAFLPAGGQRPKAAFTAGAPALPVALAQQEGDVILLSRLLTGDITLSGPYDSDSVLFSLPANWRLSGGAQFDLLLTSSFNTASRVTDTFFGPAGTLTVEFNETVIGVIPLDRVGAISQHFEIPAEAMQSKRSDGLMQLRFFLNSGWSCYLNENMLVYIHTGSRLTLPHETFAPDTNLTQFPAPIFQDFSIFKNTALVVIPDQPSAAELQSALTVAAAFGNLTSGSLILDMTTVGKLTAQQVSSEHLILIGRAAALLLSPAQVNLPMPISNGQFENGGGRPDDGIVEMVNSPWSLGKVVLVVSGNTDAGTIKAAQAVSTGKLRANSSPNLAVIETVQSAPLPASVPADQSFGDLGYGVTEMRDIGVNYATYTFYIPPGQTVSEGAFLELFYGHSALLQYESSGIVVRLNSRPIGSVALTKESASQAVNQVKIPIPAAAVVTGYNRLELRVNLIPLDRCINPDLNGLYANIWPESHLFLPLTPAVTSAISGYDLSAYPAPFAYNPAMDTTAFVLEKNSLSSWKSAFTIANYLGDRSNGSVTTLAAYYGDNVPESERGKYNFIVIGRPSRMPFVAEMNDFMPAPFTEKSDIANEPPLQVKYRIDPAATVGYIEMLSSPWKDDNVIVAALGNTDDGVAAAASYLIEPKSYALAGNFAVINGKQVITADTRLTAVPSGDAASGGSGVQVVGPPVDLSPAPPYRPAWVLPVLILSFVLALAILLVVIINSVKQSRSMRKAAAPTAAEESGEK